MKAKIKQANTGKELMQFLDKNKCVLKWTNGKNITWIDMSDKPLHEPVVISSQWQDVKPVEYTLTTT